jgi:hypothetical protein
MLLDNYSAIYLVNSKDLLKLRSFIKASYNKCIKAGSLSLLILKYSKRVIKKALNSVASLNSEDLVLLNAIVIKGFYINIIKSYYIYVALVGGCLRLAPRRAPRRTVLT